jgi:uncharacterized protein HemX
MKSITRKTNTTTLLLLSAFALMLTVSLSIGGMAQAAHQDHAMHTQEMKAPQTAQEHRARATQYEKKAAEYRQDIATHRKMLADYSKTVAKSERYRRERLHQKDAAAL